VRPAGVRNAGGGSETSGAKALNSKKGLIAALKALRHSNAAPPKIEFFGKL
jgi:hypothetical protein